MTGVQIGAAKNVEPSGLEALELRLMRDLQELVDSCQVISPGLKGSISMRLLRHEYDAKQLGSPMPARRWLRVVQDRVDPCTLVVEIHYPKWVHDCDACIFLGQYQDSVTHDLYACSESGAVCMTLTAKYRDGYSGGDAIGMTLIARYGNEGSEYTSMPESVVRDRGDLNLPTSVALERLDWLREKGETL